MKFNWGHGITIAITSFMVMILYFVFDSFNHKSELVADDYYAQEVAYQKKIDKINNSKDLAIAAKYTTEGLMITYPKSDLSGTIHFFRPSDVNLDFVLDIQSDTSGLQVIDASKLKSGFWRIKAEWSDKGIEYFSETSVIAL